MAYAVHVVIIVVRYAVYPPSTPARQVGGGMEMQLFEWEVAAIVGLKERLSEWLRGSGAETREMREVGKERRDV